MSKIRIYCESITTHKVKNAGITQQVRVWRRQKKHFEAMSNYAEIQNWIDQSPKSGQSEIAEHIIKLKGVNAVQVSMKGKNGIVLYKNWP